ncbi:MAG: hypothetical protein QM775_35415 [Pirellulales bacterium]
MRGNRVAHTCENAYTRCVLQVSLVEPLDRAAIEAVVAVPSFVEYWANDDPHYPLDAGYHCGTCLHSVEGPRPK